MKVFVEGRGCSANLSETEQIKGFLLQQRVQLVSSPEQADFIVLNTCGVKKATESRMLNRIKKLNSVSRENGSQLIVSGCLPGINKKAVSSVSESIVLFGTDFRPITQYLGLQQQAFSPLLPRVQYNSFVSMIAISSGCLSACSFCGTKLARGHLKSFPVQEIVEKVRQGISTGIKEFWLASQDNGCYGFDIGASIVELVQEILRLEGNFRLRIGMASPQYLGQYFDSFMGLFEDEKVYRFVHLPVQSGSDRVLSLMKRNYSVDYYRSLVQRIRERFPDMSFSTDIIVGFPSETEEDFQCTLSLLSETLPDVVNISRYGERPGTIAARMPGQVSGQEKKRRSRVATKLCARISLQKNLFLLGTVQNILVTERGQKGNFVGRTSSYKPVVIEQDLRGRFARAKIEKAFPHFLEAKIVSGE